MQVGIALGECHLQVQKLETTMVQLSEVSDDITDVIGYLKEQTGMLFVAFLYSPNSFLKTFLKFFCLILFFYVYAAMYGMCVMYVMHC